MELLTDTEVDVGLTHEFIDEEEESIYRGYMAVNPESGEMTKEVDYLAGDNRDEVMDVLEEMNP
jgi:hypothetical protein